MGDSLIRIGTEVDGDPALACPHMAQWWPVFTALVKQRSGVSLEILQAAGSYSSSWPEGPGSIAARTTSATACRRRSVFLA